MSAVAQPLVPAEPSLNPNNKTHSGLVVVGVLAVVAIVAVSVTLVNSNTNRTNVDELRLSGHFATYPGYTGGIASSGVIDMSFSEGGVELRFDHLISDPACASGPLEGVSNSCGLHFHAGTSCATGDEVMGHYYDAATISTDPWSAASYVGDSGRIYVQYGYDYSATEGHTFVIHDVNGARIACELLLPQTLLHMNVGNSYPGSTSISPTGTVDMNFQRTQVTFYYSLSSDCTPDAAVANSCGIHFHSGFSCDDAALIGGHLYDSETHSSDPWATVSYSSAVGNIAIDYGYDFEETYGQLIVLHNSAGARLSCDVVVPALQGAASLAAYPGAAGTPVNGDVFLNFK